MTLRDQFVEETGWNPNKGLFFNDYALWLEARDKEHLAKIEKMQQTISRQMDLRADATRELATLQQSIEDAPPLTWGLRDTLQRMKGDDAFTVQNAKRHPRSEAEINDCHANVKFLDMLLNKKVALLVQKDGE